MTTDTFIKGKETKNQIKGMNINDRITKSRGDKTTRTSRKVGKTM
jgi:hypothetical protein